MTQAAVARLLWVFGVFQAGAAALIQTEQTVVTAVGQEARFSCLMIQSKEVLQVTWQKLLPEGEKNFATNNKYFGQRVTAAFKGKVEFGSVGLHNCSIVIREVTEQDEGCYRCLFNTYPDGAFTGTTCLTLYELHEPILHVEPSNSTEEAVVSCSSTGRPAPTVTLTVLRHNVHASDSSSVSVTNPNRTVTVTTTAVVHRFHDSTRVRCVVGVPSGPQREASVMIPEVKQSSADGVGEDSGADDSDRSVHIIVSTFVAVAAVVCVAVVVIVLRIRRQSSTSKQRDRDSEEVRTPQAAAQGTRTPLFSQDKEQIRLRMSTGKSNKSDSAERLTAGEGCKRQLLFPTLTSPTQ